MESTDLFMELLQKYGPFSAIVLFHAWRYMVNPAIKKSKGTYVSYEDVKNVERTNKELILRITVMEDRFANHLDSASERERRIEGLSINQERFDRDLAEMKIMARDNIQNQKTTNKLLGENKDLMRMIQDQLNRFKKDN